MSVSIEDLDRLLNRIHKCSESGQFNGSSDRKRMIFLIRDDIERTLKDLKLTGQ